ncbi:unnamed protein product [Penicillium camemberti]|uniref:Str. FM013 n=1 Tax=Penicillium camemberti (strain FM 013) TaxID=1429867 RepID=A0A0G4PXI7_PENC3|nr:unnamed protein product [Penicillium camemberti]
MSTLGVKHFKFGYNFTLADRLLEPSTKAYIWKYLFRVIGRQRFFYSKTLSVENVYMIRETTGKRLMRLSKAL